MYGIAGKVWNSKGNVWNSNSRGNVWNSRQYITLPTILYTIHCLLLGLQYYSIHCLIRVTACSQISYKIFHQFFIGNGCLYGPVQISTSRITVSLIME